MRRGIGRCFTSGAAGLLLAVVAGCGGAGNWIKPGADAGVAGQDYQECLSLAEAATRTEADIDQDISATRQSDAQRSGAVRIFTEGERQRTRSRGEAIMASCMQSKGYRPGR